MTPEISADVTPHWIVGFEKAVDAHFTEDLALEREFDEHFRASDLLGASSVLHLQAMQEAALGNSAPARVLAETAIYFADLCLSLSEGESVQVPRFVAIYADATARANKNAHAEIQAAAEQGVEAARDRLVRTTNTALEKALDKPLWLPHRFALIHTYCYALQIYANIAQDRFQGTDPTIYQRNRALWQATDMVDRLLVTRDEEEVELHLSGGMKLQLANFAFDLIEAYGTTDAEAGLVLEAQDACYQGLLGTVEDVMKDVTKYGRWQPASQCHYLSQRIGHARDKIYREQGELGLRSKVPYGKILESWPVS